MRTKAPNQADKMLAAAIGLFGTKQFHEVRMEDIAAAAGVGKGTLYRYFRNKDDLYFVLLTRAAKEIQDRLAVAIAKGGSARTKLVSIVAAGIGYFDEQPFVAPLIQQVECLHGTGSPWQTARDAFVRLVCDIFNSATQAGEFTVPNAEQNAMWFIGGVRHLAIFGKRPRPSDLPETIVGDFLDGAARCLPGSTLKC